jgi:hypothetical protein
MARCLTTARSNERASQTSNGPLTPPTMTALSSDARREVKKLLQTLLASTPSDDWPNGTERSALFMRNGMSVGLSGDEAEQYAKCRKLLAPPATGARPRTISNEIATGLLHDAIVAVIQNTSGSAGAAATPEERVREVLNNLETRLSHAPQLFDVRLLVEGVRLPKQAVREGPVVFVKRDRVPRERWLREQHQRHKHCFIR